MTSNGSPIRSIRKHDRARPFDRVWLAPLALGVLSIVAGLIILATDWTVRELALFAGILFVLRGVGLAINALDGRQTSVLQLVAGVGAILAGIWLMVWPDPSLLVLAIFIGAWITASGVVNVTLAVARRDFIRHWALVLAVGIVEILLGIWAMRRPDFSLTLAITVLGFWAILTGVLFCVVAVELRRYFAVIDVATVVAPYGPLAGTIPPHIETPVDMVQRLYQAGLLTDDEVALLLAGLARVPAGGGGR
jgi:uncharacterized membrane protein HdeD (DUF308 family)